MRKLFILPSLICLLLAIIFLINPFGTGNAASGPDYVRFVLWLFAAIIFFIIFWPMVGNVDKENGPIIHVFGALFAFTALFIVVASMDLWRAGLSAVESVGYGFVIGIIATGFILMIKGK